MSQKKITILATITAVIIVGAALYFWNRSKTTSDEGVAFKTGQVAQSEEAKAFNPQAADAKLYTNTIYNFTFKYPNGYTVADIDEGDGNSVLVQSTDKKTGFQVYISPFDEPGSVITKERIEADTAGDVPVENPQAITVADTGAGLAFTTQDPSLGQMREVWFVFNGNLYQINTTMANDILLQKVMSTWTFGS